MQAWRDFYMMRRREGGIAIEQPASICKLDAQKLHKSKDAPNLSH
jgi:hypothetical protein